ncbi:MAG: hypothetical protein ACYC3G_00405 [Minisyncoccota bacterium]
MLKKFSKKIIGFQGIVNKPHSVFGIGFKNNQKINEEIIDTFIKKISKYNNKKTIKEILINTKNNFLNINKEIVNFYSN